MALKEEEKTSPTTKKKLLFVDEHYYYNNRSDRSQTNPIIDPSEADYRYLLTPNSVIDIRKLAPLAGLVIPTEVRRKEDLVAFLSAKLPGLLPPTCEETRSG